MKTTQEFINTFQNEFRENGGGVVRQLMIAYAREAIKADRENITKHATIKDFHVPNCDNHTTYRGSCVSCGRIDNPNVLVSFVDKDSIINAPQIELL